MVNKERLSLVFLFLVFLIPTLFSYFGFIVPSSVGLISDLLIFSLGLAGGILASFLGKRIFAIYLVTFWIVCVALVVTNWWHYQFFRAYFNFEVLRIGGDSLEAVRSLPAFEYKWESAGLFVSSGLAVFGSIAFYRREYYRSYSLLLLKAFCLMLVVYSFEAVSNVSDLLKKRNAFVLSPEYFHPVHAFFLGYELEGNGKNYAGSWETFKSLNESQQKNTQSLVLEGVNRDKQYNVITIVMESMRASMVGLYNPQSELTPNLDGIGKTGIVVKNFYANSNLTIKAETSIFCGIYDHGAKVSIAEYAETKQLRCLPQLLTENGYDTYYFHGNSGRFYNRIEFMPLVGFKTSYFHKDQSVAGRDGRFYSGWGLADGDMYKIMLDKLEKRKGEKPFFANMMTLTSHYPFNAKLPADFIVNGVVVDSKDDGVVYERYRRSLSYADYALGVFWKDFKESSLYDNTIVVITGDHGIWSFPEGVLDEVSRNENFFRMPLVIYHPGLAQPLAIEGPGSQIDIMPTLADLLGLKLADVPLLGKSLLSTVEKPWAVYGKGGELFMRYGNTTCYNPGVTCGGIQQSCFSSLSVEEIGGNIVCDIHDGDLLRNGQFVRENKLDGNVVDLYEKSYEMVVFDNQRVFVSPEKLISVEPKHKSNVELR